MTLQRYNQIILAVAGTLGAVLLLALSMLVLSETVNTLFPDDRRSDDGIIATQEAKKRAERNERVSLISEEQPQLVDTTRAVYLVPVVERRLRSTESIGSQAGKVRIGSGSGSRRVVGSGSDPYVNYVVYDARTGTSTPVLNDRVLSPQYIVLDDETSLSLFASVIRGDTNENGTLDPDDRAEIMEYDLREGTRHVYGDLPRFSTFRYDEKTQTFFVAAWAEDAADRFENEPPTRVYRVDRDTRALVPVLPGRTRTLLQSILDGTAEPSAETSADEG